MPLSRHLAAGNTLGGAVWASPPAPLMMCPEEALLGPLGPLVLHALAEREQFGWFLQKLVMGTHFYCVPGMGGWLFLLV